MRVLRGESATWALGSLGRGRTDGQQDRVSQGILGGMGMLLQPDLPMHPRNMRKEESEEAKATGDVVVSLYHPPTEDP